MDTKNRMAKFRRVTDLFEEGKMVVLQEATATESAVCVWVNKLNPFEMEEARKDGAVGRARAQIRLEESDSPEHELFEQALVGRDKENVVDALVSANSSEDYVKALDDIRAIDTWVDKIAVLERADEQMRDAKMDEDDPEWERLSKLNQDYMAEVQKLYEAAQADRKKELMTLDAEAVTAEYKKQYLANISGSGFLVEYRISETYFALRDCSASPTDNGWDHTKCDHRLRLCQARSDVRELPEGLLTRVRTAIEELNMPPREAGNSDAPASSSASSEQPSAAAESTPSTPVGK